MVRNNEQSYDNFLFNGNFTARDIYGNECTVTKGNVKRQYTIGFDVTSRGFGIRPEEWGKIVPTKNGAQYYGKPIPDFVMDTVKDLRGNRIKLDGNRIVGQAGPIYTSVSSYYSRKEAFKIRLYVNEDNKLDILQTKLGWLYESIKNMAKESTKGIKGDIIKYTFHSNDGLTVIYDAGQPYDDGYCSHETHDGHITISDSGKTLFYLKQYADVVSAYNYLQERIKLEYADVKGSIDDLLYNRLRNLRLDIEALIENNEVDVTNLSYNGQCR